MKLFDQFLQVARRDTPALRQPELMEKPLHFDLTHFRAVTSGRRKFVYCPIGNICSWSEGDYDHAWCHWCKKFFDEIEDGHEQ